MRTRTRSRDSRWTEFHPNGSIIGDSGPLRLTTEEFVESNYPNSCNCIHVKNSFSSGVLYYYNGGSWIFNGYPALPPDSVWGTLAKFETTLNWDKLPSSSQFGIIQILAELDETIAIFGRKFWRELSYGSLTWGLLPLISDLRAISDTIARLSLDLSHFPYEDQFDVNIDVPQQPTGQSISFYGHASFRFSGYGNIKINDPIAVLLDQLGLHPDFATAWDLIPLSFLVDYFIPVGSFLESFRTGGWVNGMLFTGWRTIRLSGDMVQYFLLDYTPHVYSACTPKYEYFKRDKVSQVLECVYVPATEWEFPSFVELFNLFYVLGQAGRR